LKRKKKKRKGKERKEKKKIKKSDAIPVLYPSYSVNTLKNPIL